MGMEMRGATERDVAELATVMAGAFSRDPVFVDLLSARQDADAVLKRLFTLELRYHYLPRGRVEAAIDDGRIVGATMMSPPGAEPPRSLALKVRFARALGRSFWRATRSEAAAEGARPGFPHWYLAYIAVAEAARGKGIGSALLDRAIDRAGQDAVYLESTSAASQALYERKGFIPLGVVPRPGREPEVGMWRPGLVSR